MRFLLACVTLLLTACSHHEGIQPEKLQPFSSDGCSLFPDQSLINQADWCDCCVLHDIAYWRGGTRAQRKNADKELRDCVLRKSQDEVLASLMYEGVRFGGSPYFYNWYRWGYGWGYARKYQVLNKNEMEQVKKRWRDFLNNADVPICPLPDLRLLDIHVLEDLSQ